ALAARLGARRATGVVLAAVGAGLAVPAAIVGVIGLEQALTVWNDQLGLLPWGLARILGITTYLEIPDATAWWAAAFGAVLLAVPAAIVGVIGLEQALTVWNDQLGLLPWGLARILGITTYLEIPDATAWWAAAFGAVLLAVGLVLALLRAPHTRRLS